MDADLRHSDDITHHNEGVPWSRQGRWSNIFSSRCGRGDFNLVRNGVVLAHRGGSVLARQLLLINGRVGSWSAGATNLRWNLGTEGVTTLSPPLPLSLFPPTTRVRKMNGVVPRTLLVVLLHCPSIYRRGVEHLRQCPHSRLHPACKEFVLTCATSTTLKTKGYNGCLTAVALGGMFFVPYGRGWVFHAMSGVVGTTIATGAVQAIFAPLGLPVLTFPFVLMSWVFCLSGRGTAEAYIMVTRRH